jgi:cyclopropane-fatty-acyl-phospholipid synthase
MVKGEAQLTKLLTLADIKIGGSRHWDIIVHDDRFYSRVLRYRELGLGESYIDGWWECKSIDRLIAKILSFNIRDNVRISPSLIIASLGSVLSSNQGLKKSRLNAEHHYNIGNDLYERMLDRRMIYSCGYWKNTKTLDEAQENKLDLICQKLQLKKGMKLLDIGCGWGGFAKFASTNYGVHVTAITLASEQIKIAKLQTKGLPVEILQEDYRQVSGSFDRIVSIGMFEHVGPKNYKNFFAICRKLLAKDGIMLHHTISTNSQDKYGDPFIRKYIFPGGLLPTLSQISDAIEDKFIIEDVQNIGPDYDKTLMAWHSNFIKHYDEIKSNYDERFYKMWEFYLLICAGAFRARHLQLWQIVMRNIVPAETYISPR